VPRLSRKGTTCAGLNGKPCDRPAESGRYHCVECRRQYDREYKRSREAAKRQKLVDCDRLVRLVLDEDFGAAKELASEMDRGPEKPEPASSSGLQSVLDKYAASE